MIDESKIPTEQEVIDFIKKIIPKPDSPTEIGYVFGFIKGAKHILDLIKHYNV